MSDEEVCGDVIDHYPKMAGNVTDVCARPPHSSRAWHKSADGNVMWKKHKTKKAAKGKTGEQS